VTSFCFGKSNFPNGKPLFPPFGQQPEWRVSFWPDQKAKKKGILVRTKNEKCRVMRSARGRLGMTQFDLARAVGCSESQIAKIETGRATPEAWLKEAIAKELNIQTWEVGV
jgi:DNA-binding XRE family transcriptional regulator